MMSNPMTKIIISLPCNGRGIGQDSPEHIAACPTCNARQKEQLGWIKKQEAEAKADGATSAPTATVLPKNR